MTERTPEHPNTPGSNTAEPNTLGGLRRVRTVALAFVVALPPVLNAQNIVEWANSPGGLGLPIVWAWVAFGGLDLIASVCVLETLIQSQLGRKAGAFAALVWLFAGASAYAGYRHGTLPDVGRDVKWFFPLMAFAGPVLLHLILKRSRLDKQLDEGRRITHAPASAYGWARWVPGVGAFGETYCAWRVGRLEGIVRPAVAIARYRALRPDAGRLGLRVLRALRVEAERQRTNTQQANRPAPRTPVTEPNTEPAVTPNKSPNGRAKKAAARKPNNGQPNTDTTANLERVKAAFPDWRERTPSVRVIAGVLGVAVSTGLAYRNRLIAEQGDDKEQAS